MVTRIVVETGWSTISDPMQRFYTRLFHEGDRIDLWWDGPFVKEEAWYPFTISAITASTYVLQSEDDAQIQVNLPRSDYKLLRERDVDHTEEEALGYQEATDTSRMSVESKDLIQTLIVDQDKTVVRKANMRLKPDPLPLAITKQDFPASVEKFQVGTLTETLIDYNR